jgi:short-subunit dehydrogenase
MKNIALITGATSGIGLECARILAQKGYNLCLVSNQEDQLPLVQKELNDTYAVKIYTFAIDLSLDDAAFRVHQFCEQKKLEIEILINNAGIFFFDEVAQVNPGKATTLIKLHVLTTSLLCHYIGKQMKERKRGYIMNVSSISAYKDFPGIAFYASSKKYIKGFTRSFRTEMKYYGVHVTALCPGATATQLYDPNVIDVNKGLKLGIMMTAHNVAKKGIEGMFARKSVVIPGTLTKIMTYASVLTPQWMIYLLRKQWRKLFGNE